MRRISFAATGLALGLVLSACGSATERDRPAAGTSTSPVPDPATLLPGPGRASPGATTTPGRPGVVHVTPTSGGRPGESPAPVTFPWESKVPADGSVQPACVVRGGTATITVHTDPNAAVIYHAVYSGTKGGAPPPYGSGYGGSAGGRAGADGLYRDSWVVRADAPVGPARVDVVVGNGEDFGYDDAPFVVAENRSRCP